MNKYIGHELQLYGVEEVRLVGGKGDGMRMLNVKNATGLEFTVSLDRCADLVKVYLKGTNYGFFAPCGYVSPKYYDNVGSGFLKSFTAGFLTTCGLTAVGAPCEDEGEELPLHGTISNTPCENYSHWIENDEIHIKAVIRDAALFSYHLILEREYICPLYENVINLIDKIKNIGNKEAPFEILYHCNIGYPILSEKAKLNIPSESVVPRDEHAKTGIDKWNEVEIPQEGYEEMCYFHDMKGKPVVSVFNEEVGKGLEISYDTKELKCFTQWKMMGEYEYVMGLEPGNCLPSGRRAMREQGMLEFLKPDEEKKCSLKFTFKE